MRGQRQPQQSSSSSDVNVPSSNSTDGLSVADVERLQKMPDTQLQGGKGNGVLDTKGFDKLFEAQNTPEAEGKGVLEELCVGQ